jgi:hypothetical protein
MDILYSLIAVFSPLLIWFVLHVEAIFVSLFLFFLFWLFYRST